MLEGESKHTTGWLGSDVFIRPLVNRVHQHQFICQVPP